MYQTLKTFNNGGIRCPVGLLAELNAVLLEKKFHDDPETVKKPFFTLFSNAIFIIFLRFH